MKRLPIRRRLHNDLLREDAREGRVDRLLGVADREEDGCRGGGQGETLRVKGCRDVSIGAGVRAV